MNDAEKWKGKTVAKYDGISTDKIPLDCFQAILLPPDLSLQRFLRFLWIVLPFLNNQDYDFALGKLIQPQLMFII